MKTEQRAPETLKRYELNNKKHPGRQISAIAESILEFWFVQPVVITPDGTIVIGHARVEAAELLGLETVPCLVVDAPEEETRRLRLVDNRLSDLGEYDVDAVLGELKELDSPDLWAAFAEIVGNAAVTAEVSGPPVPDEPVVPMTFVMTEAQKETVYHAINLANAEIPDVIEGETSGAAAELMARKYLARRGLSA